MPPDQPEVKDRLDILTAKLDMLIARVETRLPDADRVADRVIEIERIARGLADTVMKLTPKRSTIWTQAALAGAVAGAIAGAIMAVLVASVH